MSDQRVVQAPVYRHGCGGFYMEFELRHGWTVFFTKTAANGISMHIISPESRKYLVVDRNVPENAVGDAITHAMHVNMLSPELHNQWVQEQATAYSELMANEPSLDHTLEGEDVIVDYLTGGDCVQSLFNSVLPMLFDDIVEGFESE